MPVLRSAFFGEVDYGDSQVIEFPSGLPAFEQEKAFVLFEQEQSKPILFLQSLGRPELVFPVLPAHHIVPDYQLVVGEEDRMALGAGQELPAGQTLVLAVVTIGSDESVSANLMAPVVINLESRLGLQVIPAESEYSHQFPLRSPSAEETCS
jgi:flagellar assembly factor FliW